VATTAVELNSYQGAVRAPRPVSTPNVSTDIARVSFGDESNEPGIHPRRGLSLNLLRPRKRVPQPPTFDFALQEGNGMLPIQVGARRVVNSLPRVTSDSSSGAEDRRDGCSRSGEAVHSASFSRVRQTRSEAPEFDQGEVLLTKGLPAAYLRI
jgi:hypothetical protein